MRKKLQDMKWLKYIGYAIFSWLTAISLSTVSGYRITEINLVIPIMMAGIWAIVMFFDVKGDKTLWKSSLWFAVPFALTLVLGSGFSRDEGIFYGYSILDVFYFAVLTVFMVILMIVVSTLLNQLPQAEDKSDIQNGMKSKTHRFVWLAAFLCCLIAWLPYYLTYFPGIVSKDYIEILNECLGNIPLTNHHPILYVLCIKAIILPCKMLGGMQFAIAIATTVQVILFAAILSYMVQWMYKKNLCKAGCILTTAFIALHPVMPVFSLYMTKDVLFSGIFLLYVLELYDIVESKGAILKKFSGICKFVLLNLLVVFFRNNGIYIVILTLAVCCAIYRKMWKRLAVCMGIVLLSYGLLRGPVFTALEIENESFAETMSIPLQQIAQTICDDGEMSDEDAAFLGKLMPLERVKEIYTPGYTDPYKFDEAFHDTFLNENKGEFLKVWARVLPHNLGSYMEAYLIQTAGYWHISETDSLNAYGVIENELGITQNNLIERITHISLEPVIEQLILVCRKAPILCFLTNMAFMVFLTYYGCICCWRNGKKQYILPVLPLLLLWATIMVATPASCKFRYLFPFYLAYPFLIWNLLKVSKKEA